jgi:hypothetical protein
MDVCLLWVLSGRRLCDGRSLVQRSPTECCVSLSVIKCNINPLHAQWVVRRGQSVKERKIFPLPPMTVSYKFMYYEWDYLWFSTRLPPPRPEISWKLWSVLWELNELPGDTGHI